MIELTAFQFGMVIGGAYLFGVLIGRFTSKFPW